MIAYTCTYRDTHITHVPCDVCKCICGSKCTVIVLHERARDTHIVVCIIIIIILESHDAIQQQHNVAFSLSLSLSYSLFRSPFFSLSFFNTFFIVSACTKILGFTSSLKKCKYPARRTKTSMFFFNLQNKVLILQGPSLYFSYIYFLLSFIRFLNKNKTFP